MPYGSGWHVSLWYEVSDHGQNRLPCFASLKPLLDNNDNHLTTSEPLSELMISGEVTHPVRRAALPTSLHYRFSHMERSPAWTYTPPRKMWKLCRFLPCRTALCVHPPEEFGEFGEVSPTGVHRVRAVLRVTSALHFSAEKVEFGGMGEHLAGRSSLRLARVDNGGCANTQALKGWKWLIPRRGGLLACGASWRGERP